ncbi:MAG: PIN domain-containing protein [Bacteroidota bacterium]
MERYATDTVGIVRHLKKARNIGKKAKAIFEKADKGMCVIHVPAIVLMEILYLTEKGRVATTVADVVDLTRKSSSYMVEPITSDIVVVAKEITDIPELHDRMIAATARHLNLDLITRDTIITHSAFVKTIW